MRVTRIFFSVFFLVKRTCSCYHYSVGSICPPWSPGGVHEQSESPSTSMIVMILGVAEYSLAYKYLFEKKKNHYLCPSNEIPLPPPHLINILQLGWERLLTITSWLLHILAPKNAHIASESIYNHTFSGALRRALPSKFHLSSVWHKKTKCSRSDPTPVVCLVASPLGGRLVKVMVSSCERMFLVSKSTFSPPPLPRSCGEHGRVLISFPIR